MIFILVLYNFLIIHLFIFIYLLLFIHFYFIDPHLFIFIHSFIFSLFSDLVALLTSTVVIVHAFVLPHERYCLLAQLYGPTLLVSLLKWIGQY